MTSRNKHLYFLSERIKNVRLSISECNDDICISIEYEEGHRNPKEVEAMWMEEDEYGKVVHWERLDFKYTWKNAEIIIPRILLSIKG